jgi:hypothetical protein
MTAVPLRPTSLRRHPLALQLAAVLLAAASLPALAQTSAPSSWVGFRSDPARRLFPQLPAARKTSTGSHAPNRTLAVTNCDDDGPGSLRTTIAAAVDGDTVDLGALRCGTITLRTGAIPINLDNLVISGPRRSVLSIDGGHLDRVFLHYGGGTLTLQDVTISGGFNRATGFDVAGGGCIASAGYLSLYDSTLRNCYAGGEGAYGGALYAYGLTMSNSTLSGNHAYGVHPQAGTAAFGGAAFVYGLLMATSTVSGNRADHRVNGNLPSYDIGGGIVAVRGGSVYNSTVDSNFAHSRGGGIAVFTDLSVFNSTISGNVAATEIGGGLFLRWPSALQLGSSTITDNRSGSDGGGIWLNAAGSAFGSSIIAGNSTDIGNRDNPYGGPIAVSIDGDHNLMGQAAPLTSLPPDTLHADPHLRALAYNGGPTRTHALDATSPAIDAGDNPTSLLFDQRGANFPRVSGTAADIGAFEVQATPPLAVGVAVPTLSGGFCAFLTGLLTATAWRRKVRLRPGRTRRLD